MYGGKCFSDDTFNSESTIFSLFVAVDEGRFTNFGCKLFVYTALFTRDIFNWFMKKSYTLKNISTIEGI